MTVLKDSPAYLKKQQQLKKMLTIYGRNPVLEALENPEIKATKLHLASSNKPAEILTSMMRLAEIKGADVVIHERNALSRISKNGKQDQGVALDIICNSFITFSDFESNLPEKFRLIALEGITNPQNLGMIIRSVCASPCTALLLPDKGCAKLDSLVIKASAGTLFKADIIRCGELESTLTNLQSNNTEIFGLDGAGTEQWSISTQSTRQVFVLGNETTGLSNGLKAQCNHLLRIPMSNNIESLNVAVAASIVAFQGTLNS